MGSEKSAYKEVGLQGRSTSDQPRRKKESTVLSITRKEIIGMRWGHQWNTSITRGGQFCRYCRGMKFMVDGAKCRGKK